MLFVILTLTLTLTLAPNWHHYRAVQGDIQGGGGGVRPHKILYVRYAAQRTCTIRQAETQHCEKWICRRTDAENQCGHVLLFMSR